MSKFSEEEKCCIYSLVAFHILLIIISCFITETPQNILMGIVHIILLLVQVLQSKARLFPQIISVITLLCHIVRLLNAYMVVPLPPSNNYPNIRKV